MTAVTVSTRSFQASHGRTPRGTGSWAFFFGADASPRAQRDPWFVQRRVSFSTAKREAVEEAKRRGETFVEVGA